VPKKSEIREQARAGLDALLKVASATDDQLAGVYLQEALEHIAQAGHGVSLREVAARRGSSPASAGHAEDQRLREAIAFATGQTNANPLTGGGDLLERLGLERGVDV
jgi:hypothetical protein